MTRRVLKISALCMAITACFILLVPSAEAQTRTRNSTSSLCKSGSPNISVRSVTEKTKYIKNRNADSLTNFHNTGSGITLGLAGGPIEISVQSRFAIQSLNGSSCVSLDKLNVLFTAKPEIHIASNFKIGTCEYREVLNHEQKHIRTLRRFVREQSPKLRREIQRIVRGTQTKALISESNVERAQERIQSTIINSITAYQNKVSEELKRRQALIDTKAEYERVARACPNWNKKLAQKRRR